MSACAGVTVGVGPEPIDGPALLAALGRGRSDAGGLVSFTGVVRGGDQARPVVALELEHYPGYTEARIRSEAEAALRRFGLAEVVVAHRVGRIAPGETVVFVGAAAGHRRDAFQAVDSLMDWLKTSAPFWKREHRAEGAVWIEPRPQDHDDARRWAATA